MSIFHRILSLRDKVENPRYLIISYDLYHELRKEISLGYSALEYYSDHEKVAGLIICHPRIWIKDPNPDLLEVL